MSSYNKVILLGNLTRDPELKHTPKGTAVCQIGLAINHTYKVGDEKREEVTFIDVEFFGRTAEIAAEYLKKGGSCMLDGRLKLDSWDDKQSGQKRTKLKVVGETLQLLGGKENRTHEQPAERPAQRSAPPRQDPDDDLNF